MWLIKCSNQQQKSFKPLFISFFTEMLTHEIFTWPKNAKLQRVHSSTTHGLPLWEASEIEQNQPTNQPHGDSSWCCSFPASPQKVLLTLAHIWVQYKGIKACLDMFLITLIGHTGDNTENYFCPYQYWQTNHIRAGLKKYWQIRTRLTKWGVWAEDTWKSNFYL